jgi:hypothetical protein
VIQHFEGDVRDRTSNLRAEPLLKEEISLLGPMDDPAGLGSGPVSASRLADIPMILGCGPRRQGWLFREPNRCGAVAHDEIED